MMSLRVGDEKHIAFRVSDELRCPGAQAPLHRLRFVHRCSRGGVGHELQSTGDAISRVVAGFSPDRSIAGRRSWF